MRVVGINSHILYGKGIKLMVVNFNIDVFTNDEKIISFIQNNSEEILKAYMHGFLYKTAYGLIQLTEKYDNGSFINRGGCHIRRTINLELYDTNMIYYFDMCYRTNKMNRFVKLLLYKCAYGHIDINHLISIDDKLVFMYRSQIAMMQEIQNIKSILTSTRTELVNKLDNVNFDLNKEQVDKLYEALLSSDVGKSTIRQLASEGVMRNNDYLSKKTLEHIDEVTSAIDEKNELLQNIAPLPIDEEMCNSNECMDMDMDMANSLIMEMNI